MVSGISFGGLASGLDTEEMIEKLMHLERAPIRKMESRKGTQQLQREIWQGVNTRLSAFSSGLRALRQSTTFTGRRVESSAEGVLTATGTDRAERGSYDIRVDQLATAHRMVSSRVESISDELGLEGQFALRTEAGDLTVYLAATDGMADVRDRINDLDAGVRASIVDNRLVLTAEQTGAGNRMHLVEGTGNVLGSLELLAPSEATGTADGAFAGAVDGAEYDVAYLDFELDGVVYEFGLVDADGNVVALGTDGITYNTLDEPTARDDLAGAQLAAGATFEFDAPVTTGRVVLSDQGDSIALSGSNIVTELAEARDAVFNVDGIEVVVASNHGITDVLPGVTLDLHALGESTLTVDLDTGRTGEALESFVEEYNALQTYMGELSKKEGILQGDSTLMRLQTALRRGVADTVALDGDPDLTLLSQIGISIDRDGEMTLDSAALGEALREDPRAVERLFAGSEDTHGADGVARRLDSQLHTYLRYGDGVLAQRDRMYERSVSDIDSRIESLERRMGRREESLRRQFTQLERMLSDLHSQGQWLEGQIDGLMGGRGNR